MPKALVGEPRLEGEPDGRKRAVDQQRVPGARLAQEVRRRECAEGRRSSGRFSAAAARRRALLDLFTAEQSAHGLERPGIRDSGAKDQRSMVVENRVGALAAPAVVRLRE